MKRHGFTLVELMLVVSILGILGALAMPMYQNHATQARESAAKSDLSTMRAQIELYKLQHNNVPPGYVDGAAADLATLELQLVGTTTRTGAASANKVRVDPYQFGPYLKRIPDNPFNDLSTIAYVAAGADMAAAADGTSSGWLYKRETGEIRLNYTGTDSEGMAYTDY
jgi:general secretion pathway protein G